MTFSPTHRDISARFRPLVGIPISLSGNWDGKNRRYGVKSANAEAVMDTYEASIEEMERQNEAFCGSLEVLGTIFNIRSIARGEHYPVIIFVLA